MRVIGIVIEVSEFNCRELTLKLKFCSLTLPLS